MKFVSVDPSLSNTAIVWGTIKEDKTLNLLGWRIVASKKSTVKIPVMEDRLNRIKDIFSAVDDVLLMFPPDVCFGEYPTGSLNSSAAVSLGISLSILAKLPNFNGVTALDVKKVVGIGVISKDQIMDYCLKKYPDFSFEKKKDGTLVKARMEHVADAAVIAEAGLKKMKIDSFIESNGRTYKIVPTEKIVEANKEIKAAMSKLKR